MRWPVILFAAVACRPAESAGAGEHAQRELEHGIELVQQGELAAGIAALRAALDAAPEDAQLVVRARSWLASALTRSGDPEGAQRECGLALELAPEDPWLHYASGVAWYQTGELERARDAFTRGLELDPRQIKCWQWRARVLLDLKDGRSAIDDLTRALECIEGADEAALASWGGDRRSLLLKTLNLRLQAYDDLGLHDAAMRDRERYRRIFDGEAAQPVAGER